MSHLRLTASLATLAALAACAGGASKEPPLSVGGRAVPSVADRHVIDVAETERTLEIAIAGGAKSFDVATIEQLLEFARAYEAEGHGPLLVSEPAGAGDRDQIERRAAALRAQLADLGVPAAAIARGAHPAVGVAGKAPIRLSYALYLADAPECTPLWEQNLAYAPSNQPWESFGCATRSNLAMMVADPRDLIEPRAEAPGDAHRRQTVLDAYRKGDVTHAERSQEEQIAISRAVR